MRMLQSRRTRVTVYDMAWSIGACECTIRNLVSKYQAGGEGAVASSNPLVAIITDYVRMLREYEMRIRK